MIEYLVLAVAPGIFWLWFFWRKDRYEKEPAGYLVKTFFLGALVVFPAALLEEVFTVQIFVVDMMIVGLVEEIAKFLAVFLYVYRKSEFNEVMDGIVYSAAASLGFASLENLFYILAYGPGVMVGRAILSTLGHVLFASFWGYSLGVKKITGKNTIGTGLLLAIVSHGIYDVIVMSRLWYVTLLVIPLMVILYKSTSGRIKQSLAQSPFKKGVRCSGCGAEIPAGSRFCPDCGKRT
jgi:RsiW-degrading membrane proteinase PrsW (M82 family)